MSDGSQSFDGRPDDDRGDDASSVGSVGAGSLAGRVDAVVVGTSAGGVDALLRVLPGIGASMRIPIHVVVHLPRGRRSLLADVFGARCAMRVVEAEDKMPVEAGTIYFAPPDYHLLLDRGPSLALSIEEAVRHSRPSIDVLFESAADLYGPRLAAVVLTGASDDGAAGLLAVKQAGGIAIVQDPAGASAPVMPAAALRRVAADFVLPLPGIAALLRTLEPAASAGGAS